MDNPTSVGRLSGSRKGRLTDVTGNTLIQHITRKPHLWLATILLCLSFTTTHAQDAHVSIKLDPPKIVVGDEARVFLEATTNPITTRLQWATIPDSFNNLEVRERGKIDTIKQSGTQVTYRQRIIVTGFDSGAYTIPSFQFAAIPGSGNPYTLQTDSLVLGVSTVAVDTTKPIKPIVGIIEVQSSWKEYLLYIIIGAVLLALIIGITIYLARRKKPETPKPVITETLQEKTLRLLQELEKEQLWEKGNIKEYYTRLTDILRGYIEVRFDTPAMELTTDELLAKARTNAGLSAIRSPLAQMLYTADMAKFARAEPTPQEHVAALEAARIIIRTTTPVITDAVAASPATGNNTPATS